MAFAPQSPLGREPRSKTVGVLVHDITQPYWAGVFQGVEQYFYRNTKYDLVVANTRSSLRLNRYADESRQCVKQLVEGGVQGIVAALAGGFHPEDIEYLTKRGVPFVSLQQGPASEIGACVQVDDVGAAYEATRHLLGLGHQRILHAAGPVGYEATLGRRQGFLQALQDARAPLAEDSVVGCGFGFWDGFWCMKRVLAEKTNATAMLFVNDAAAFGGLYAAREAGVDVPRDISVMGLDHVAEVLDYAGLLPDLTSMRLPLGTLGETAAELLAGLLRGKPHTAKAPPMSLYPGETCAAPPDQSA